MASRLWLCCLILMNKKSWLAHFDIISSVSQKLSHALYTGSISLYMSCQECHTSFSSLVTDVKLLSVPTTNICMAAPRVFHVSTGTLPYCNINYDQHFQLRTMCLMQFSHKESSLILTLSPWCKNHYISLLFIRSLLIKEKVMESSRNATERNSKPSCNEITLTHFTVLCPGTWNFMSSWMSQSSLWPLLYIQYFILKSSGCCSITW